MEYVKLITENSAASTRRDVEKLLALGWKEDQVAEAVYITAMFAFFNRVADSFGIAPQNYLEMGRLTP
jgi:alkylhydroperoxidase family enzyme